MADDSIRGYRILGDRPKQRELSTDYLRQTSKASKLLADLWATEDKNCSGREEEFSGDVFPSDDRAAMMCAGCSQFMKCQEYAQEAHPAWGIFAGKIHGKQLAEAMKEDNNGG